MGDADIEREEREIYVISIVVLAPVVIVALLKQASFDGGTTICLVAVVGGVVGLVANIIRRRRAPQLPFARAREKTRKRSTIEA